MKPCFSKPDFRQPNFLYHCLCLGGIVFTCDFLIFLCRKVYNMLSILLRLIDEMSHPEKCVATFTSKKVIDFLILTANYVSSIYSTYVVLELGIGTYIIHTCFPFISHGNT